MPSRQLQTVMRHLRRLTLPPGYRQSDRALLERFISRRDDAAFAALVQRHGPMVLGVCRRVLHHIQDAEDACQAAFLVFARKAGSIRKRDCPGSWLHGVAYRIARNLSREIARRRGREQSVEKQLQSDPAGDLSWREVRAALDQEIDRLPERYRAPLVLCYLEGKTRDEAAQHLGWTLGTLRGRLERGRELLRSRLVRRGLTLGTALLGSSLANQATAALPPSLVTATVQAAKWTLTSAALPTGLVSAQVAALTKGGLKAMTLSKIKIAAGLLMALGVVGAGTGALVRESLADQPAQAQKEDSPPADTEKRPASLQASRERQRPENAANAEAAPKIVAEQATLSASAPVLTIAFSPDGKVLVSGASDGKVILWDVRGGKELMSIGGAAGEKASVSSVMFSPDGKALAGACADHNVRLWDITTGKELASFPKKGENRAHKSKVVSLAYSPDGKKLVSGDADHVVIAWDLPSGELSWGHVKIESFAFAPDGQIVAAANKDGTMLILDATNGKWLRQFGAPVARSPSVGSLAFSPDGKLVAVAGEDTVRLWDVASGKEIRRLLAHNKGVTSVAFSPDGRSLVSAGEDRTVRLWELATGKEIAVLKGHTDTVNSVAFSPDGSLLATGSADRTIKLWKWKAALPNAAFRGAGVEFRAPGGPAIGRDRLEKLLDDLVKKQKSDQESIEALYLATLARFPSELELKFAAEHLGKKEDRRAALADLLSALTNSKEYAGYLESLGDRHSPRQH
jgi:RNA polymerase sigma factor (sigma-70 family)